MARLIDVPSGMPFFVLRADQPGAPAALEHMAAKIALQDPEHADLAATIWGVAESMRAWRRANPPPEKPLP